MKQKSIIQGFPIFVALILVILTSGCAAMKMYSGEKLPEEQVAVIKGSLNIGLFPTTSSVRILAVDGETNMFLITSNIYKVEVMPGFHEVALGVHKDFLTYEDDRFACLQFNAEAGHEYKIKVPSWWKKDSLLTVIDTQSGNVIVSQPIY